MIESILRQNVADLERENKRLSDLVNKVCVWDAKTDPAALETGCRVAIVHRAPGQVIPPYCPMCGGKVRTES